MSSHYAPGASPVKVLVDGHVHLHRCFDLPAFLDAARHNLGRGAASMDGTTSAQGVLLLTESAGARRLRQILDGPLPLELTSWSLDACGDGLTVIATHSDGDTLHLVEGRQIATRERLEVLGLASSVEISDGQSLSETMRQVLEARAIAVIPWGFGKWWFTRGRHVMAILRSADPRHVFLGDNGGRPRGWRRPRLLRLAEERGFRVLPGSDPLPFPPEVSRVGSFGFALDVDLSPSTPATDLIDHISSPDSRLVPFGRGTSLPRFMVNQLRMQWQRRTAS